jgi:hypothetical protein
MADTNFLSTEVEDVVRAELSRELGVEFTKKRLLLKSGGQFNFDAVSPDGRIVASIKSSRGTTRGGKPTTGAIKAAVADLYYLSLIDADRRILVVTDAGFYERLAHDLRQRIAPGLELKHVQLPPELDKKVHATLDRASDEMRSRADGLE